MRKGERQGVGDRYRDTVTKIEKIIFLILCTRKVTFIDDK